MLAKIKSIIDKGSRFLITAHIDPDGDALGSCFSLYWALDSIGKEPHVYLRDSIPYRYEFLPRPARLSHTLPQGTFDGIFVLDCGNLFRVGDGYERLNEMGPLVNIDHHETNEPFGIANLLNPAACCTAELLYSLYEFMGIAITPEMATNVYTAVLTDTGSFRFGNTNPEAFLIAEKMLRAGVKPAYVSQMVYNSHPKERFKLLGFVLSGLQTFDNDTVAMASITNSMFMEAGAAKELTDGFVEYIKEIKGVEVAAILREVSGGYKISLRSRGTVDVARICSQFGGGGHRNAAGCTIGGTLEEARQKLKEALRLQ